MGNHKKCPHLGERRELERCIVQTTEQIEAEIEEGFRQIEADRIAAEDAAYAEYHNNRLNDAGDYEDEYLYETTEVNVGGSPGGWKIFE